MRSKLPSVPSVSKGLRCPNQARSVEDTHGSAALPDRRDAEVRVVVVDLLALGALGLTGVLSKSSQLQASAGAL